MSREFVLDTTQLERRLCLSSYYHFVKRMWSVINDKPLTDNWHIKYIADELQAVVERIISRQPKLYDYYVINQPPGSSKSSLVSIFLEPWAMAKYPPFKTIVGSYTESLSLELSRKSREILLSDRYRRLFPEIEISKVQNNLGQWTNTQNGTRIATTTGGSVIGKHADLLIVDDPIDPAGARSDEELMTANTWVRETLPSRRTIAEIVPTIICMQRLHQSDATNEVLSMQPDQKVRWLCFPAEILPGIGVQPPECAQFYRDGLFDPERFSKKTLAGFRRQLGEYGYAGQFQQQPVPPEGGMFKVANLTQVDSAPMDRIKKICRYWDKAGTARGGKYTVGLKLGMCKDGYYWILDIVRGQWDTGERERQIMAAAKRDGKRSGTFIGIEQEPGSGGKESAENTSRALSKAGFIVRVDRPTGDSGDKTARAEPVSVIVNQGMVRIVKGHFLDDFLDEMHHFPHSSCKDQIDALSGAFSLLTKRRSFGIC